MATGNIKVEHKTAVARAKLMITTLFYLTVNLFFFLPPAHVLFLLLRLLQSVIKAGFSVIRYQVSFQALRRCESSQHSKSDPGVQMLCFESKSGPQPHLKVEKTAAVLTRLRTHGQECRKISIHKKTKKEEQERRRAPGAVGFSFPMILFTGR